MELFEAGKCDVFERKSSKHIELNQVGLRCRFCAHLKHKERLNHSSTFPLKLEGVFNAMLPLMRHITRCPEMPKSLRLKYDELRKKEGPNNNRKTTNYFGGKHYWKASAQKLLGIVETNRGLFFNVRPTITTTTSTCKDNP